MGIMFLFTKAWKTDASIFAEATVIVYVNDVNEKPIWPQSLYIADVSEYAEIGDIVYHLTAVDYDEVSATSPSLYHLHYHQLQHHITDSNITISTSTIIISVCPG